MTEENQKQEEVEEETINTFVEHHQLPESLAEFISKIPKGSHLEMNEDKTRFIVSVPLDPEQ